MGKKKRRNISVQYQQTLDNNEAEQRKRRSKIVKRGDFRSPDGNTWIGCTLPIEDPELDDD